MLRAVRSPQKREPRLFLVGCLPCIFFAALLLADGPGAAGRRRFGADEAPPPGIAPSRPQVVMRLAYSPRPAVSTRKRSDGGQRALR